MTDMQQRPDLTGIDIPTFPPSTKTADLISGIPGTSEFQALLQKFEHYPDKSYMFPPFRTVMYMMVRMLKPQWAVEIGSLFAGTSEIITSALAANGSGRLTTIDPFGAERVPGIIGAWPAEWQKMVDYRPSNSMQLFMDLAEKPERPDFVFIDGNHEYEYALFDLLNSVRYLRPGGVIVLDNYHDYGVRLAGQKFEADNPAWDIVKFSPHSSLGSSPFMLHLDGLYRIYVAPKTVPLGAQPKGFNLVIDGDGILGLDLKLAEPSQGGRLFYKIYLRTIPYEFHLGKGDLEEMSVSADVEIPAGAKDDFKVRLPVPLATKRPRDGFHRRCEINVLFESNVPGQPLILSEAPAPALFHR